MKLLECWFKTYACYPSGFIACCSMPCISYPAKQNLFSVIRTLVHNSSASRSAPPGPFLPHIITQCFGDSSFNSISSSRFLIRPPPGNAASVLCLNGSMCAAIFQLCLCFSSLCVCVRSLFMYVSVYVCVCTTWMQLAKKGRRGFRSPEAGVTGSSCQLPSHGHWEMNLGTPEEQQGF